MLNISDIYKVLDSLFRDLGWEEPTKEDFDLLYCVIDDLNSVSDSANYVDQDNDELLEILYDEFLDEKESGYDPRGRGIIDVAVDFLISNS